MKTLEKVVEFLRNRTNSPHFHDPAYVADMLLGTVYATATVIKPGVRKEGLWARFRDAGGTKAQYEAGLRHALQIGWLVLDEVGTSVTFTQAGMDMYC